MGFIDVKAPTLRAFSSPSERAPTLSSGWSRTPRSMISAMCFRAGPYLGVDFHRFPNVSKAVSMVFHGFSIAFHPFSHAFHHSSRALLGAVVAERHVVAEARLVARGRQGIAEELQRLGMPLLLPEQRALEDLPLVGLRVALVQDAARQPLSITKRRFGSFWSV